MKLIFAFVAISIVLIFGFIVFERRSEKLEANRNYIVTNVGWIAQALEDKSSEIKSIKIEERAFEMVEGVFSSKLSWNAEPLAKLGKESRALVIAVTVAMSDELGFLIVPLFDNSEVLSDQRKGTCYVTSKLGTAQFQYKNFSFLGSSIRSLSEENVMINQTINRHPEVVENAMKERAVMKWLFNGAIIEIDRWIINTTENGLPY